MTKVLEKSDCETCLKNSEDFTRTTHNHYFNKKKEGMRKKKGKGEGWVGVTPFTNYPIRTNLTEIRGANSCLY